MARTPRNFEKNKKRAKKDTAKRDTLAVSKIDDNDLTAPAVPAVDLSRLEYEIWVRKLRAYRRSRGWLQRDVIERMPKAISRCHYVSIEHGRSNVSYKHLYNLSKAFDISMAEMVTLSSVTDAQLKNSLQKDLKRKKKRIKKGTLDHVHTQGTYPMHDTGDTPVHVAVTSEIPPAPESSTNKVKLWPHSFAIEAETQPSRGRPKGSRVITCTCGARVVGFPDTVKKCYFCKKFHTIPAIEKTKTKNKKKSKKKKNT